MAKRPDTKETGNTAKQVKENPKTPVKPEDTQPAAVIEDASAKPAKAKSKLALAVDKLGDKNVITKLTKVMLNLEENPNVHNSQLLFLELSSVLKTESYGEFEVKFNQINSLVPASKEVVFSEELHHGNVDAWSLSPKDKTTLQLLTTILVRTSNRNTRKVELSKINTRFFLSLLDAVSSSNLSRYYDL